MGTGTESFSSEGTVRQFEGVLTEALDGECVPGTAESRVRQVFENAREGMYRTTADGRHLDSNAALARMYGFASREELLDTLTDPGRQLYVDPRRRDEFIHALESNETVAAFESAVFRKDGSVIWISENARAVRGLDGELLYYEGTVVEITERKKAETALRLAEEKYRSIFENAVEGIFQTTPDGRYMSANPAIARIYGYDSPDEMMQSLTNIGAQLYVQPGRREEFARRLESDDRVSNFESQIFRRDGTVIWISEHARAVRDETGQLIYYEGAVIEITDQKMAEEALLLRDRAIAATSEGIVITDWLTPGNPVVYVNSGFERITGYRKHEILGRNCRMLQGNRTDRAAITKIRDALTNEHECIVELLNYRKDGTPFWNLLALTPVRDVEGRVTQYIGVQTDISERKQAEEALRLAQFSIDNAGEPAFWISPSGRFFYVNEAACRSLGYSREELLQLSIFDIGVDLPTDDWPAHWQELKDRITWTYNGRQRSKDNRVFPVELTFSYLEYDGKEFGFAFVRDITERKAAEDRLFHDAFHDALTGLPNRSLFMDRMRHALERTRRQQGYLFAVLFFDLDRFKLINDSMGHLIGDQLLVAIAGRLQTCLRPGDTIARLGGDEFTVLVENIRSVGDAIRVVERIHDELKTPFCLGGNDVFTNASIGIAMATANYQHPEDLLRDADTAMYRAKALGTTRYAVFHTAMHVRAVRLLQLETDLRRALERSEFRIHYQPIIAFESGRIAGFEALLRWQHPERGMIQPIEFISIAEETGLIIPIGGWVLDEACRQTREWQKQFAFETPLTINVNFSGRQLMQPDLISLIKGILVAHDLTPDHLRLEITESAIMENVDTSASLLREIRAIGVQLQMDDFGTGYSSLSYLHRFPVNALKIDRSFVGRMGAKGERIEIVRTIVALAQNLGMDATAEGVESAVQLQQLRAMNCRHGQGYYFAKPMSSDAASELLTQNPQW